MAREAQEAGKSFDGLEILEFSVAGVKMGVDVRQVAEVIDFRCVEERTLTVISLPEVMSFGALEIHYDFPRVLLPRAEGCSFGILVDRLEEITRFPLDVISPLPALLEASVSPRGVIWAVAAIAGEPVLLVDFFALLDFLGPKE